MHDLTVIDLFCGIGGFSKGLEKAGFKILLGIDNWPLALKTFEHNHKNTKTLLADIRDIEDSFFLQYKNRVDVIVAGPPCQGFSMSGKRDPKDKRNNLFEQVIRAVDIINPKIVVIENVVGLLSMQNSEGKLIKLTIEEKLKSLGYEVNHKTLDASDYGVPQARKRVIFIGSKIENIGFPKPYENKVTVLAALSNIPDTDKKYYKSPENKFQLMMSDNVNEIFNHEPMKHNNNVLTRIKHVPQGGNWQNIPKQFYNVGGEHSNNYRRLAPDKPSITLKHATKSMIIHPIFNRVITAREVARLQSFPDSFRICGTKFEQHQQLANAVPPLLARAIGEHIITKIYDITQQWIEIKN